MNVYLKELKLNLKSLIIWSVLIIIFVIIGMQKYSSLTANGTDTKELLSMITSMPRVIQVMWGLSLYDISTPLGYFAVLYPFILIMLGIYASNLGSNIITKEQKDKTFEFLMVKPMEKSKILTAKIFASLTDVIIFNIIATFSIYGVLSSYNVSSNVIFLCSVSMLLFQIVFLFLSIAISVIYKKYKTSGAIALGLVLGTYVISTMIDIFENINFLKILTPFKYFDAKYFVNNNTISINFTIVAIFLIIILLSLSYIKYGKKEYDN